MGTGKVHAAFVDEMDDLPAIDLLPLVVAEPAPLSAFDRAAVTAVQWVAATATVAALLLGYPVWFLAAGVGSYLSLGWAKGQ